MAMMIPRLRLANKSQKGFTLIELMLVFAITGIISSGITMTFYQLVTGSARANNQMTLVSQVQSAGYWVSHDAQLIQEEPLVVRNGSELESFTLNWTDWDGAVNTITYTLDGAELWRDDGVQQSLVARLIDPAGTNVEFADGVVTFTVTATIDSGSRVQSENRVYRIAPRPSL